MPTVNKAVTDLNDLVKPCYETQNRAFGPLNFHFLERLVEQHKIKRALDVGTGEGSFVLELAERTPKTKFDAIDVNSQLIQHALQKKRKAKNKQINFICSAFDRAFPKSGYDMILARFAVEHMTNITGFVQAAYSKLKHGGVLAIIEYYIDAIDIDDPLWLQFRKKELALYKKIKSHPRPSLRLPHDMNRAGFKKITSSIMHVSPSTIGPAHFFDLVAMYAQTWEQVDTKIWPSNFVKKILRWCEINRRHCTTDPTMFITHTVGFKI